MTELSHKDIPTDDGRPIAGPDNLLLRFAIWLKITRHPTECRALEALFDLPEGDAITSEELAGKIGMTPEYTRHVMVDLKREFPGGVKGSRTPPRGYSITPEGRRWAEQLTRSIGLSFARRNSE